MINFKKKNAFLSKWPIIPCYLYLSSPIFPLCLSFSLPPLTPYPSHTYTISSSVHLHPSLCISFQDEMPLFAYILMGTLHLTLLSTISTCFLPETLDKVMAETVQEKRWKENADIKGSSDEETVVPLTSEGGQTFKTFNPS